MNLDFFPLFGGNSTPKSQRLRRHSRICRFEELESREMLSVTVGDIQSAYTHLDLLEDDYNIIEVGGDGYELTEAGLNAAIADAGASSESDIIVIHADPKGSTIALSTTLAINIDAAIFGSVTIVSYGGHLTLDATGADARACTIASGSNAAMAGLTIAGGSATGSDGFGGGFCVASDAKLTLADSTIAQNTAFFGAGIYNEGAVSLMNCTIAGNSADLCGGIYNGTSSTLTINSTIVAANTGSPDICCVSGMGATVITGTNNLIGDSGTLPSSFMDGGNLVGDPMFVDLDNGNFHLLPGSPALGIGAYGEEKEPEPSQAEEPTISVHPQSATYTQGQTAAVLTITATGNGELSYQWYKDGEEIVDATSDSYTPSTETVGSAQYHCVVTNILNGSESTTSDTATITVNAPPGQADEPTISVHPQSATYTQGQTAAVLTITATGNGKLSYQWYKDGEEIVDATSDSYTPSTETVSSAQYHCVVTNTLNGSESTTSDTATITVSAPPEQADEPVISVHPQSVNYTQGQDATALTITASGNGILSYQWYKDGALITDATSDSYIPTTANVGEAEYYCVVTNTLNGTKTATSETATITVSAPPEQADEPVISVHPQPASYTLGQTAAVLTVTATGNGELSYQWYKDGEEIVDATSDSYTPSTETVGSAQYHCVVTNTLNGSESTTSDTATITVSAPLPEADEPTISVHPQSASYTLGQTAAVLTITATGNGTLTYKWYRIGSSTVLSEEQTYTPPTAIAGIFAYYCIVTNTLNGTSESATSNIATITVSVAPGQANTPTISVHPQSASYTSGQTAIALSVTASGNGTLSYQWYKVGSFDVLSTSQTYTPSTAAVGTAGYYCIVTNTLNGTKTATSDIATITITTAPLPQADTPTITAHPLSASYTQGDTATALIIMATGNGTLSYQWYKDGEAISGATSATYIPLTATISSSEYYCIVTNTLNGTKTATSDTATITVNAPPVQANAPTISVHPQSASYTPGQTATALSVMAGGNGILSYQWYKIGSSNVLSTSRTYAPSTATVGTAGYYCVVTNTLNGTSKTATSTTATITVAIVPTQDTLTVTGGTNSIEISWTDPIPEGSVFQFKRENSNEWMTWKGIVTENTATIPGLAADMYEVRLLDSSGNVCHSENGIMVVSSERNIPKALKPKAKVVKKSATISSITVSWTDPKKATAESNARYVVSYSIKVNKKWTVVEQSSTAENRYTFIGLQPKTSYRVTVTAVNAQGEFGTNKTGKITSIVNITAKTLKYTAVKVSAKLVKFFDEGGAARVEATLTPPTKIPAGATYDAYNLYRVIGSGKSAVYIHTPISAEFFTITEGILTINWSELGLSDTNNKFILRAVTDGVESAATKITVKFSTLKTKQT